MKSSDWILCIIVLCVWSSSSSLVSIFTTNGHPIIMAAFVVFISTFLLSFQLLSEKSRKFLLAFSFREHCKLLAPALLGLFIYPMTYFFGIYGTSPIKANVLNYLWPFVAFVSSRLIIRKTLKASECIAMLLSLTGAFVVLLFNRPMANSPFQASDTFYVSSALAGAFSYGIYTSIIEFLVPKAQLPGQSTLSLMPVHLRMFVMELISSFLYLCVMLWFAIYRPEAIYETIALTLADSTALVSMIFYACVNFTLAHLLWNKINSENNVALTANTAYLIPLFSTILLSYTANVQLGIVPLIGLVLIVTSIILNNIKYINSINVTFVGTIIFLVADRISPIIDDANIVENARYFLEVIIAIYSIYYGFVMSRVIEDYKEFEQLVDSMVIFRNHIPAKDRDRFIALENRIVSLKRQNKEKAYEKTVCQLETFFPSSFSGKDIQTVVERYYTFYRANVYVLSLSEWIVISLLCVMAIVLCFIIRSRDALSVIIAASICATVLLCVSLLYDYEVKIRKLIKKFKR